MSHVTGRTDWTMGYDKDKTGALLVAMEAKRAVKFSEGGKQLLAYLFMLRELRKQSGRKDTTIQGFHTDGQRFCFVSLLTNGRITESGIINIKKDEDGLDLVYSWIITIMNITISSSPRTSPQKGGQEEEQDMERLHASIFEDSIRITQGRVRHTR